MTTTRPSLTSRICDEIVTAASAPLAGDVQRAARQLFLDGISVAVAGARLEEAPRLLLDHFEDSLTGNGGGSTASVFGLNTRLGTVPAALVNGASMHVLDFEPMWLPATHALSPALAPTLALGQALGGDGAKMLKAIVLGIEIQGRLRQAAGKLQSHELKFHPPGFVGPIGAAVASGFLLDFDAGQYANAIGIAGSRCGSLFANLGTMTKSSHTAYAAAMGLEAALLTRRGFTGTKTLFDPAPQSYGEAFFPNGFNAEQLLDFGKPFRVVDPGYAIKIFPAKFSTHYAITAALMARPQVPAIEAIKTVRIRAADVPSSDRPNPASGLDGKFSLQYTAAAALLDGNVGLASFTDDMLRRPDMQALLGKMQVTLSREIPSIYTDGRYLDLEVELEDGRIIATRCDRPRGSWGAPPITEEEHHGKARDCLATWLDAQSVERFVDGCDRIAELDAAEVSMLLDLASTGGRVAC
ncbi:MULTISPECIES: MmgE/PrpD family protein [unclassified Rhizobium]|uniref:MmgE/PrpD family protein n=1 Tax=unclassified Rhizobium TaxID=2613769 RepID=UPI001ADA216D|nr:MULTISPECIES: MmgE/PrpD family protein [unclassified Rhizobium]MBO9100989.1 MmgE/PrpD family protein [Rhizobium sp. L58/93]MBO9136882.1 MmgE/PrpD family protein [Rhizobium sp. B209b/85]MBO9171675.1 MmgE/PrpD family protein [Rhizobium sp. L245/93]MBO9186579.1 MmgE/PrpD family protein [Rhizobium sp. E27B/91]QXZ86043.1 MmgE/PrpD family protein [Rhizobium sp. K1/93]